MSSLRTITLCLLLTLTSSFTATLPAPRAAFTTSSSLNAAPIKPKLQYVPAIQLDQLPKKGSATSCVAGGLALCIVADSDGSIYALGDKCPPVGQPLSFGKISKGIIADPVLGTTFNLKTGEVVEWCPAGVGRLIGGLFDPAGVPTYPCKKQGKNLMVQVDVNAKFAFEQNYWSGVLDAQGKSNGKYY